MEQLTDLLGRRSNNRLINNNNNNNTHPRARKREIEGLKSISINLSQEIEFLSPEETFSDPELIRIAKGIGTEVKR